jgi:hypothetical protein
LATTVGVREAYCTFELYLVPKHWAAAVGRRTKVPQKEKKMAQIQTAYRA